MALKTAQFALTMRAALIPLMASNSFTADQRAKIEAAFNDSGKVLDDLFKIAEAPDQE